MRAGSCKCTTVDVVAAPVVVVVVFLLVMVVVVAAAAATYSARYDTASVVRTGSSGN